MTDAVPEALRTYRVRDIMQTEVVSVRPDTTVRDLVRLLAKQRIGGVPVLGEQDELIGIVTTTDLVRLAADAAAGPLDDLLSRLAPGSEGRADDLLSFLGSDAWGDAESLAPVGKAADGEEEVAYEEYQVRDLMRSAPHVVRPEASIDELARVLLQGRIHRAPVVDGGRLVGIVTTFDVLRAVVGAVAPAGR